MDGEEGSFLLFEFSLSNMYFPFKSYVLGSRHKKEKGELLAHVILVISATFDLLSSLAEERDFV